MIVFQLVCQAQKNKWEKQSSQGLGPQCILGKGDAIQPVTSTHEAQADAGLPDSPLDFPHILSLQF